jgi:hypothetical protein
MARTKKSVTTKEKQPEDLKSEHPSKDDFVYLNFLLSAKFWDKDVFTIFIEFIFPELDLFVEGIENYMIVSNKAEKALSIYEAKNWLIENIYQESQITIFDEVSVDAFAFLSGGGDLSRVVEAKNRNLEEAILRLENQRHKYDYLADLFYHSWNPFEEIKKDEIFNLLIFAYIKTIEKIDRFTLKTCQTCQKFFSTKLRVRALKFCSQECKARFHNFNRPKSSTEEDRYIRKVKRTK